MNKDYKQLKQEDMKEDIEKMMYAVKDKLQDLVANYLDVNREHINICYLDMNLIGEDYYDWAQNPDDACEEEQSEAYYSFAYEYRNDKRTIDYEEPVYMVWQHIEGADYVAGFVDRVMNEEEFDNMFEAKKSDPCSMWFEESKRKEAIDLESLNRKAWKSFLSTKQNNEYKN